MKLQKSHIALLIAIIAFIALGYTVFKYQKLHANKALATGELAKMDARALEALPRAYGIELGELQIHRDVIKRNESLADILTRYNVPYQKIIETADLSKEIFDLRRIKHGNPYAVIYSNDSLNSAKYFVYEEDRLNYLVYDLSDSIQIYREAKPSEIKEKSVTGVINSSLYQTFQEAGVDPTLAVFLADIYAWTIDFYRIDAGDRFKIIYRELYVENEPIAIEGISAAVFNHRDKDYFAFEFEQEGKFSYFDEQGRSLRKQFLRNPLNFTRISSRFTNKRYHPVLKRYKAHLGVDYAAPTGTPIKSVGDGVVLEAQYKRNNGRYVKVKHNSVYTTQYLHMSKIASGIKKGAKVNQGQIIGYVGSTGLATGPHLCFRFWKNGRQVNPFSVELPPSEPVLPDYKALYEKHRNAEMLRLDKLQYDGETFNATEAFYGF